MSTYGIALLSAVAVVLIIFLIDKFYNKNLLSYIITGKPILAAVTMLAKAIGAATGNTYFDTAYIVMKAATEAAEEAENLWKAGALEKPEREAFAYNLIEDTLTKAGITVTTQVEQIIQGAIAITCMLLPHEKDGAV